MAGKFELKTSRDGRVFFNLKADNGEVILTGESYTTKEEALRGIESVRKNSQIDELFERKLATNWQPYFSLKATNGQLLGRSEMYSGVLAMENGISSLKLNAIDGAVDDQTAAA